MATHHVKFINCEILNCVNQGILSVSNDCEFINLNVHHNGKYWFTDQGFYQSGGCNRIIGCTIHDNAITGIQLWNNAIVANINGINFDGITTGYNLFATGNDESPSTPENLAITGSGIV